MNINKLWEIDLAEMTAKNNDGVMLKCEKDGKKAHWVVISGNPSEKDISDAVKVYEHEYSKSFINYYKNTYKFSIREIADVSSSYSSENGLDIQFTEDYINNCMIDEDFLTIKEISIIRSAIYFYAKGKGLIKRINN